MLKTQFKLTYVNDTLVCIAHGDAKVYKFVNFNSDVDISIKFELM